VLASAVLLELARIDALGGGAQVVAILLVALVGVLVALPTFAEIPLGLGLLAAGALAGAAAALLIGGPAINLASLFALGKTASTRIAVLVGGMVTIATLAAAVLAECL
jgi:uncharacterized membrane protein YraQ (UPF0718 family)